MSCHHANLSVTSAREITHITHTCALALLPPPMTTRRHVWPCGNPVRELQKVTPARLVARAIAATLTKQRTSLCASTMGTRRRKFATAPAWLSLTTIGRILLLFFSCTLIHEISAEDPREYTNSSLFICHWALHKHCNTIQKYLSQAVRTILQINRAT